MALKRLSDEHYQVIEYLLLPVTERPSNIEIAERVGIHRNTVTNWQKDPLFQAELRKSIVANHQARLNELVTAMYDHAITDGNAAMAKNILQMHDMLTDKVSVESTVKNDGATVDDLKARIVDMKRREGHEDSPSHG